jgi:hypothetical protein
VPEVEKQLCLIKDLFDLTEPNGFSEADIAAVRAVHGALPAVLETYYRLFGRDEALNT